MLTVVNTTPEPGSEDTIIIGDPAEASPNWIINLAEALVLRRRLDSAIDTAAANGASRRFNEHSG